MNEERTDFENCEPDAVPSNEAVADNAPFVMDADDNEPAAEDVAVAFEEDDQEDVVHAEGSDVQPAVQDVAAAIEDDGGLSASISSDPGDVEDGMEAPVLDAEEVLTDDDEDVDFDVLREKLMALQQKIRAAKIPVIIDFEGWDTAGKGSLLGKLLQGLDPRGYKVYTADAPTPEERRYPTMRRYWTKMPAQGNMTIFCNGWYREVSSACFEGKLSRKQLEQRYTDIIDMESQLVSDGAVLIKFFLHIPRKEQKKRLKALEEKKNTRWRVQREDWRQNEHYEEYLKLYDAMIARTHFDGALWHVLHTVNKRTSARQMFDVVLDVLTKALEKRTSGDRSFDRPFLPHLESLITQPFPQLSSFDPEQALTEPYKASIDKAQKRLRKLQNELYRRQLPLIVCFEGWDAAGKGGAIRRLTSALDPRGFEVVPIAAPTALEKSHHHLWRFWNAVPKDGHVAVFDRTWYGRVMVERIEGFCTEAQWQRAYEEMNRFELELAQHGAIIRKFWLQIDNETQLKRFNDRQNTPDKQWKITDEDWRNREKWPLYETAVNEMLQKTNTAWAPWVVVEANNKQFARLKVLETVIAAVEAALDEE